MLVDLDEEGKALRISALLERLDSEVRGCPLVKNRVREIAALLLIDRLRALVRADLITAQPAHVLHRQPGTGKTTMAMHMGELLHELGYLRKGQLVTATRDDLVGQYVGHTAPKTKEVLKRAMGGVLLIDEAYYLYRPENERDYGQEAIEILLQFMEAHRDDLVVILAGYKERMDVFFRSNPGMASRIAHHIDFPDFSLGDLTQIADRMLADEEYRFSPQELGVPRVHQPADAAAPLRQRAQHQERHRPPPGAGSGPAGSSRRSDQPGGSHRDLRSRRARQPRLHTAARPPGSPDEPPHSPNQPPDRPG